MRWVMLQIECNNHLSTSQQSSNCGRPAHLHIFIDIYSIRHPGFKDPVSYKDWLWLNTVFTVQKYTDWITDILTLVA